jgi:hypothetical protein
MPSSNDELPHPQISSSIPIDDVPQKSSSIDELGQSSSDEDMKLSSELDDQSSSANES